MDAQKSIDRRTLVKALAAGSAAGLLAGCSSSSTTPEAEETGDGGGSTPESTPTDTATPESTAESTSSSAGSSDSESFGGWMDNVGNYDGVVDKTGQSEVTVKVGVDGNGGAFGFGPPAVRVDAGTTVVWKWTGAGGTHNVSAEDGSFESELTDAKGHTFERTFEESGAIKYACVPHQTLGMKGVVVVE